MIKEQTPIQRALSQILEAYNTNINAVANGDKALQRQLQRQIKEGAAVTESVIRIFLERFPDVNPAWLFGEGEMLRSKGDMRPHYPASVAAGTLGGISEAVMDYDTVLEPTIEQLPDYDFTIDVSGPSMEPTFFDGDVVACRSVTDRNELLPGRAYVFDTRDGAVLKRFDSLGKSSLRVTSDNPEFKPYNIDLDSVISISEVVGSLRNEQNARFAEWLKDYSTRSVE